MKFKKLSSALLAVTMIFSSSALVTANAQTTDSHSSHKKGDLDFDGVISPEDIAKLQDYLYGDYNPGCSEADMLVIADINNDGVVDWDDERAYIDAVIYASNNLGDVNGDEKLSILDATEIQKYLAHLIPDFDFAKTLCADFNGDNRISVSDATEIQKELAGLTVKDNSFPTKQVIENDKKYRAEYAEYIDERAEAAMKGCYVIKTGAPEDGVFFRDSTWLYRYSSYDGLMLMGTYDLSNKNISLPGQTEGGATVRGVAMEGTLAGGAGTGSDDPSTFAAGAKGFGTAGDPELVNTSGPWYGLELTSVIIPANYVVGKHSFASNLTLKYAFIGSGSTIENDCFKRCISLSSVSLSAGLKVISSYAFSDTNLSRIRIPNTVTSIGNAAFARTKIDSIKLEKNISDIGEDAFIDCPLNEVYVYNPSAKIGISAFYNWNYTNNGLINPNCVFYGYENSTLKEHLEDIKSYEEDWGDTMTYKFVNLD